MTPPHPQFELAESIFCISLPRFSSWIWVLGWGIPCSGLIHCIGLLVYSLHTRYRHVDFNCTSCASTRLGKSCSTHGTYAYYTRSSNEYVVAHIMGPSKLGNDFHSIEYSCLGQDQVWHMAYHVSPRCSRPMAYQALDLMNWNYPLHCIHRPVPFTITFKDCVIGALHARLVDWLGGHTLHKFAGYIKPAEGVN